MPNLTYFELVHYSVGDWSAGTYERFDLRRATGGTADGQIFVSLIDGNSQALSSVSENASVAGYWGNFQDPNFDFSDIWNPSYETSSIFEPRVNVIAFGDGYAQRSSDGVNHQKMNFDISFKEITSKEAKSVLAFFEHKGSVGSFKVTVPEPYGVTRYFIAKNWGHQFVGYNRHNITAKLEEVFDQVD